MTRKGTGLFALPGRRDGSGHSCLYVPAPCGSIGDAGRRSIDSPGDHQDVGDRMTTCRCPCLSLQRRPGIFRRRTF